MKEYLLSNDKIWEKYQKHRWLLCASNLLDTQKINWSPYYNKEKYSYKIPQFPTDTETHNVIYIQPKDPNNKKVIDILTVKGEIKWEMILSYNTNDSTYVRMEEINGDVELKIKAFLTLHFKHYCGYISFDIIDNNITLIRLNVNNEKIEKYYPNNWEEMADRIYKKQKS